MSAREAFLNRVRTALGDEQRAGGRTKIEPRGRIGHQGVGADPVARFVEQFKAAGGKPYLVIDKASAKSSVVALARQFGAKRILIGPQPILQELDLSSELRTLGLDTLLADGSIQKVSRTDLFAADLGISGVDYLIAETGSLVLETSPAQPRSLSLLPPLHLVVAETRQIVADLFDYFDSRSKAFAQQMPSCVTFVTGPSKTGDIELRLVTGVHGPAEVHLVLICPPAPPP